MEALKELKCNGKLEHVFIIGGGQVYTEALQSPQCSAVHLTAVRTWPTTSSDIHALHAIPARSQSQEPCHSNSALQPMKFYEGDIRWPACITMTIEKVMCRG